MEVGTTYLSANHTIYKNFDLIIREITITSGLKTADYIYKKARSQFYLLLAAIITPIALTILASQIMIPLTIPLAVLSVCTGIYLRQPLNKNNTYYYKCLQAFEKQQNQTEEIYNQIINKINEENRKKFQQIEDLVLRIAKTDPGTFRSNDSILFKVRELLLRYNHTQNISKPKDNPTQEEILEERFLANVTHLGKNPRQDVPQAINRIYNKLINACRAEGNDKALYNTLRGKVATILQRNPDTFVEWSDFR